MHNPKAVLAERTLKRCDNGEAVQVKVYLPVPDPEYTKHGTWACGYEIVGLDQPVKSRAHGVDSMQALKLVFQAIRVELKKSNLPIAFLSDEPGYTGFERFHDQPEMEALFEHLMEIEVIRQNRLHEMLRGLPHRDSAMELLYEHLREAENMRQTILRKMFERSQNLGDDPDEG